MKILMTVACMGFVIYSCDSLIKKDVRQFIDGSYTRNFHSDFAVGMDSVVLERQDGDHYIITKYSRFVRLKNGESGKEELIEEKMLGIYDPGSEVINESKKGKVLHFDPDRNLMLIGASEYQKIK